MAKPITKQAILSHTSVQEQDKATHLTVIMAVLERHGCKLGDKFNFEYGLLDID